MLKTKEITFEEIEKGDIVVDGKREGVVLLKLVSKNEIGILVRWPDKSVGSSCRHKVWPIKVRR